VIRGLTTDDEWTYFEPFLTHRSGRPRRVLDRFDWARQGGERAAIGSRIQIATLRQVRIAGHFSATECRSSLHWSFPCAFVMADCGAASLVSVNCSAW